MPNILKNKIVVHIPHCAWVDERFVDIDYVFCRQNLIKMLEDSGITGFYVTNVIGYYKGRSYNEDLLTFFYNKSGDEQEKIINQWIKNNAQILKQECIAVEFDGVLKII